MGRHDMETTLMKRPNVLRFSCRRGAAKNVKIGTISRAEGGQLQAPVGWQARLWL
jgi:hypothetical protein